MTHTARRYPQSIRQLLLKEWRAGAGLTQAALAERLDLSPNFVAMAERGERTVTVSHLTAVYAACTGLVPPNKLKTPPRTA